MYVCVCMYACMYVDSKRQALEFAEKRHTRHISDITQSHKLEIAQLQQQLENERVSDMRRMYLNACMCMCLCVYMHVHVHVCVCVCVYRGVPFNSVGRSVIKPKPNFS